MSEDKELSREEKMEKIENNFKIQKSIKDGITKLQEENSDLKDKWQRALADYQNLE